MTPSLQNARPHLCAFGSIVCFILNASSSSKQPLSYLHPGCRRVLRTCHHGGWPRAGAIGPQADADASSMCVRSRLSFSRGPLMSGYDNVTITVMTFYLEMVEVTSPSLRAVPLILLTFKVAWILSAGLSQLTPTPAAGGFCLPLWSFPVPPPASVSASLTLL